MRPRPARRTSFVASSLKARVPISSSGFRASAKKLAASLSIPRARRAAALGVGRDRRALRCQRKTDLHGPCPIVGGIADSKAQASRTHRHVEVLVYPIETRRLTLARLRLNLFLGQAHHGIHHLPIGVVRCRGDFQIQRRLSFELPRWDLEAEYILL